MGDRRVQPLSKAQSCLERLGAVNRRIVIRRFLLKKVVVDDGV